MAFEPTPKSLFFSKNDPDDIRLGEISKPYRPGVEPGVVLFGYPDDEGIRNNSGRTGAARAPDLIRKHFYKMTPPAHAKIPSLYDFGNLKIEKSLHVRHESAVSELKNVVNEHHITVGLGGGHDYGYVDGRAFLEKHKSHDPLVINFDAHLDVRPDTNGITSGTPFYRLLNEFKFDFIEIGIQSQCNSQSHLKWLKDKHGLILEWENMERSGRPAPEYFLAELGNKIVKRRPTFLSVDIDCFSSSYAPGCSQSFATGFTPQSFLPLFEILTRRLDVRALGIYEVSPPLDTDERTSKLAALILHRFIQTL